MSKKLVFCTLFLVFMFTAFCPSTAKADPVTERDPSLEKADDRDAPGSGATVEEILRQQAKSKTITDIIDIVESYSDEEIYAYFSRFSFDDIFNSALTGGFSPDMAGIFNGLLSVVSVELKKNLAILVYVFVITMVYSVIGAMADSTGIKGVKDVTGYVCFSAVLLIILKSFMESVQRVGMMVGDLSGLAMQVTPVMITLLATGGNPVGGAAMSPVMLFYSQFCVVASDRFFLPLAVMYGVTGMVKGISAEIKLDKLSGLLKTLFMLPLGIVLLFFSFVLALQKSISATGGGLSVKLMKSLIGLVPVVGGKLSEAAMTVIHCLGVVRTAAGTVVMICIIGIAALPIFRTVLLALVYKCGAVVCEMVSEKKYADMMESASGALMLMAGLSGIVSVMFLIMIAVIIGTGNATLAMAS